MKKKRREIGDRSDKWIKHEGKTDIFWGGGSGNSGIFLEFSFDIEFYSMTQ